MSLLVVFVVLVFGYSLVSKRIERFATPAIVFMLAGILVPRIIPEFRSPDYFLGRFLWVAEFGLVLLLFTDATRADLKLLRQIRSLPARLLGPGFLLTMLLGTLAALVLLQELSLWEACIVGAILAPTDAGLGQVIVQSPRVPAHIREALNVEAGLNDGLAVPFLLFFMGMLGAAGGDTDVSFALFVGQQLGIGVLVGAGIGLGGGYLLQRAVDAGTITDGSVPRGVVALPVICYFVSESVGASMFIAAFVAGLTLQRSYRGAGAHAVEFAEQWGQLFNLAIFFLFGLTVDRALPQLDPVFFLYGFLSLTVVRMLPVAAALLGSGLGRATTLFIGWFGPRGLASIVLGLVFVEQELHSSGQSTILGVVIATVLLSVLLHGLTAAPGIAWYARHVAGAASPPT